MDFREPKAHASVQQRSLRESTLSRPTPARDDIERLLDQSMASAGLLCERGLIEPCADGEHDAYRCSPAYWRTHGQEVAAAMAALAEHMDEDVDMWWATGRLHDMDYLAHPHHEANGSSPQGHPLAATESLIEHEMPVPLILAVLEHSPHLALEQSSRLSSALVLVDEHSTMRGFGVAPAWAETSAELAVQSLIEAHLPSKRLRGYSRHDMQQRAGSAACQVLSS